MGAESGGRSSGRPPFVAHKTSELPSPFATLPYLGYENYLQEIDVKSASYAKMVSPRNSGAALMVTAVNPYICCEGPNLRASYDDADGLAVLLPAVVRWRSLTTDSGFLVESVAKDFVNSLDFPPVGITSSVFLDSSYLMACANIVSGDDCFDIEETYPVDDGDSIVGIVAPWQLTPITEAAAVDLSAIIYDAINRWHTHVFGLSNCELMEVGWEAIDGSDDYYNTDRDAHEEEHEHCTYVLENQTCSCGRAPTSVQVLNELLNGFNAQDPLSEFILGKEWTKTWRSAQEHYLNAWETIRFRSTELGDSWSTFCWQRLSPFWDTASLGRQRLASSRLSTASPTSRDSLPVSSQQLTLYAS